MSKKLRFRGSLDSRPLFKGLESRLVQRTSAMNNKFQNFSHNKRLIGNVQSSVGFAALHNAMMS